MEEQDLDIDKKNLTEALIKKAKDGQLTKFEYIRSLDMYFGTKTYHAAVLNVSKQFKKIIKKVYNDYVKKVTIHSNSLDVLLTVKNLEIIADYYAKEVTTTADMLAEYRSYLLHGHFMESLLGSERLDDDLVDFRSKGYRFFEDIKDE